MIPGPDHIPPGADADNVIGELPVQIRGGCTIVTGAGPPSISIESVYEHVIGWKKKYHLLQSHFPHQIHFDPQWK